HAGHSRLKTTSQNRSRKRKRQKPKPSSGDCVNRQAHVSALQRNDRSLIRWQHRLKRERPTCTERNDSLLESADGSMATAAKARKNLENKNETRNPLTPTGLLMEGDYTHRTRVFCFTNASNCDFSKGLNRMF